MSKKIEILLWIAIVDLLLGVMGFRFFGFIAALTLSACIAIFVYYIAYRIVIYVKAKVSLSVKNKYVSQGNENNKTIATNPNTTQQPKDNHWGQKRCQEPFLRKSKATEPNPNTTKPPKDSH